MERTYLNQQQFVQLIEQTHELGVSWRFLFRANIDLFFDKTKPSIERALAKNFAAAGNIPEKKALKLLDFPWDLWQPFQRLHVPYNGDVPAEELVSYLFDSAKGAYHDAEVLTAFPHREHQHFSVNYTRPPTDRWMRYSPERREFVGKLEKTLADFSQ